MRLILTGLALILVGCGQVADDTGESEEPENHTTQADVDMSQLSAMLSAVDAMTDEAMDTDAMLQLAVDTPMDDEKQMQFSVSHGGAEAELYYHIWREQADWVHVYFWSSSKPLVDEIDGIIKEFARAPEG